MKQMTSILVTGGAGYIGSHACVEILSAGYEAVVIDNLQNSSYEAIERVSRIAGKPIAFFRADIRSQDVLDKIFQTHRISAVMHFAGLKAVGESVATPLAYYDNNVGGSIALFEAMVRHHVSQLVFSSSATVYGQPRDVPIREDAPLDAANPYGRTKVMIEQMLRDVAHANPSWRVAVLRYFNPVGAHESGLIGEDPRGTPNNLMPYISQVAVGRRQYLSVWGGDYPTLDGTGVRDYIHVVDLAKGHVAALAKLRETAGVATYNLGTGRGHSVLEVVRAFEDVTGKVIRYRMADRRAGDIPICYADPGKAERELRWTATKGLTEMCRDSWRWQSNNPDGYGSPREQ
jgi:UDP-glucose 4-epimerase